MALPLILTQRAALHQLVHSLSLLQPTVPGAKPTDFPYDEQLVIERKFHNANLTSDTTALHTCFTRLYVTFERVWTTSISQNEVSICKSSGLKQFNVKLTLILRLTHSHFHANVSSRCERSETCAHPVNAMGVASCEADALGAGRTLLGRTSSFGHSLKWKKSNQQWSNKRSSETKLANHHPTCLWFTTNTPSAQVTPWTSAQISDRTTSYRLTAVRTNPCRLGR